MCYKFLQHQNLTFIVYILLSISLHNDKICRNNEYDDEIFYCNFKVKMKVVSDINRILFLYYIFRNNSIHNLYENSVIFYFVINLIE